MAVAGEDLNPWKTCLFVVTRKTLKRRSKKKILSQEKGWEDRRESQCAAGGSWGDCPVRFDFRTCPNWENILDLGEGKAQQKYKGLA